MIVSQTNCLGNANFFKPRSICHRRIFVAIILELKMFSTVHNCYIKNLITKGGKHRQKNFNLLNSISTLINAGFRKFAQLANYKKIFCVYLL